MGIFLFYLHYIIAIIILYHILRCLYIKNGVEGSGYYKTYYETESNKRLKHSLWIIILFIIILLIPIVNIIVFSAYLGYRTYCEDGKDKNPYYCKSIFTKKY